MCLSQIEQIVSVGRDAATIGALIAGGAWTYWLFVKNRQKYPRATIRHRIRHWRIGEGKILLHVDVMMRNTGNVLISIVQSRTTVQQVLPLSEDIRQTIRGGGDLIREGHSDVEWPTIGDIQLPYPKDECEIEPSESQEIEHDFILGDDVRTVQVYSHVRNVRKKDLSWDLTTLYDITGGETV